MLNWHGMMRGDGFRVAVAVSWSNRHDFGVLPWHGKCLEDIRKPILRNRVQNTNIGAVILCSGGYFIGQGEPRGSLAKATRATESRPGVRSPDM